MSEKITIVILASNLTLNDDIKAKQYIHKRTFLIISSKLARK